MVIINECYGTGAFMKEYKIKYFSGNDIKVKYVLAESQSEALAKFYIYVNHTDIISIEVIEDDV